jgi:hypothetical protein
MNCTDTAPAAGVRVASVKVMKMEPDRPYGATKEHVKARLYFSGTRTGEYEALGALLAAQTGRSRAVAPPLGPNGEPAPADEWEAFESAAVLDYRDRVGAYRSLVDAALAAAGLPAQKAVWGARAGCSCGCSPAFVLGLTRGVNVFVGYEVVPAGE